MKQLSISLLITALFFLAFESSAQDVTKRKTKEDKVKMKKDDAKKKMDNNAMNAASMDSTASMPAMSNVSMSSGAGMGEMLPYKAEYSSQFEIGDPAKSKMILELWKDWDDNNFSRHADYFADTVTMILPSGDVITGKDSVRASAERYRGSLTSAQSKVDAYISTRSIDRNEDWVCIWGSETDVDKDGNTTVRNLHEIWRINKDGKVDFMQQFAGTPPKR